MFFFSETFQCSSWLGISNTCDTYTEIEKLELIEEFSNSRCEKDLTYEISQRTRIRVSEGCRGKFKINDFTTSDLRL